MGPVEQPEWNTAVAQAPAHHHGRAVFSVQSRRKLGKQLPVCPQESTHEGQTDDAAMGMAAEDHIHPRAAQRGKSSLRWASSTV